MFTVVEGCLIWQDGNQGYEETRLGEFDTEKEAVEFVKKQPHNGWLSYYINGVRCE
jgi:hypothetical protein